MDPRLIKGLSVLVSIAAYFAAGGVPSDWHAIVQDLALLLCGSQAIRRAGDLGPVTGRGDT